MGYDYFVAGCISGIVQTIIGYPLDTLKILKQNNKILDKIGIRRLYSGISMPLIQTPLICGISFYIDEIINQNINNHWISGCISGIISSIILCPCEYYKINLQQNKKKIINIKTICGSYRNISYVICREGPAMGIYFGTYYELKKNEFPLYISGGIAGCTSWFFTYPLDTIKSRIQGNICKTFTQSIKMGNLFKGLHYCLLRAFIVNAVGFTTYEYCIK